MSDIVEEEGAWNGVKTNYLNWSSKHFSSRLIKLSDDFMDLESREYWSKQWMYERNEKVKQRASAETISMEEGSGRLDIQLGLVKIPQAPSVLDYTYSIQQQSCNRYSGQHPHSSR